LPEDCEYLQVLSIIMPRRAAAQAHNAAAAREGFDKLFAPPPKKAKTDTAPAQGAAGQDPSANDEAWLAGFGETEGAVVTTNLQGLPGEIIARALAFLTPDADWPFHRRCGLVELSRASKSFRSFALGDRVWQRICIARWKTKVGFATRLANAEAEASNYTDDSLINGGYWYRKYYAEERDSLRSTISHDELHSTTFSTKLWFNSKLHPEMKRIKGAVASGLDGPSLTDALRFDQSSSTVLGMPEPYRATPFFVNETGSIINLRASFEVGADPYSSLHVFRRKDWGWEFRSQMYVARSVDDCCPKELWEDYASSLIIEKRKKGVACTRGNIKYKRREVPDIDEIKEFLKW